MNNSRTYIYITKIGADTTSMPQAFFDNPTRSFNPIVTVIDDVETTTARNPSNTTISEAVEAYAQTKGTVKTIGDYVLIGMPLLTQDEIWAIRSLWDSHGDLDWKCILNPSEAQALTQDNGQG
jgi:hypothetical protein